MEKHFYILIWFWAETLHGLSCLAKPAELPRTTLAHVSRAPLSVLPPLPTEPIMPPDCADVPRPIVRWIGVEVKEGIK
jgi:hypothetical protein